LCGANEKRQKVFTTHIWQEYLDLVEQIRKTERAKKIYAQRKETIERVFADAKEKYAMNLKKLANWSWNNSFISLILLLFCPGYIKTPVFVP
jgi:hypothetical protein